MYEQHRANETPLAISRRLWPQLPDRTSRLEIAAYRCLDQSVGLTNYRSQTARAWILLFVIQIACISDVLDEMSA